MARWPEDKILKETVLGSHPISFPFPPVRAIRQQFPETLFFLLVGTTWLGSDQWNMDGSVTSF